MTTDRMPLERPIGKCPSEFYDVLLRRGMVPGMTPVALFALATPDEWDRYWLGVRIGREQSDVMWRLEHAREPQTFAIHSARDWDDPVAQDERENPPRE